MQSTELTRRSLLGAITGSIVLAGCTGDDDDSGNGDDGGENGGDNGGENGDDNGGENGDDNGGENGGDDGGENGGEEQVVQVVSNDEHGNILAGPEGRTLYMFDSDEQGADASVCQGDCADAWPPLTTEGEVAAGSGVEAELSTIEREDGSTQVTANGWPLYYFANDETEGDTAGQGVNDVWWVLAPDGTPIRGTGDDGSGGDDGDDGDDDSPGPY